MSKLVCMICQRKVDPKEYARAEWPECMTAISGEVWTKVTIITGHTQCIENVYKFVVRPYRARIMMLMTIQEMPRERYR